jgi:hypothetical protein
MLREEAQKGKVKHDVIIPDRLCKNHIHIADLISEWAKDNGFSSVRTTDPVLTNKLALRFDWTV